MRNRGLVTALVPILAIGAAVLGFPAPQSAAAPAAGVVRQHVTFRVFNTNTSDVPCQSDGRAYEIHGLLTGPRSALNASLDRSIALYLHGFSLGGKYLWTFPGEHYDWTSELADDGHVSLAIDRLGYDDSPGGDGDELCLGSAADQTHQIIQSLRRGDYTVEGGRPTSFQRVVLVGHDTGGGVAEIEAFSTAFKGPLLAKNGTSDIDALVVWGWAESDYSTWVYRQLPDRTSHCMQGGEPAEDERPDGPSGYFWWPATDQEVIDGVGMYMDSATLATALRLRNRNPCGDLYSAASTSVSNLASGSLARIEVPVLLIFEDGDVIYNYPDAGNNQKARYTGSEDVTLEQLVGAGHFPMLETRRQEYQDMVGAWLRGHSA